MLTCNIDTQAQWPYTYTCNILQAPMLLYLDSYAPAGEWLLTKYISRLHCTQYEYLFCPGQLNNLTTSEE